MIKNSFILIVFETFEKLAKTPRLATLSTVSRGLNPVQHKGPTSYLPTDQHDELN